MTTSRRDFIQASLVAGGGLYFGMLGCSGSEEAVTPVVKELEAARQRGLPPGDAEAQRLWQRFQEAVESVSQGDADMTAAMAKKVATKSEAAQSRLASILGGGN